MRRSLVLLKDAHPLQRIMRRTDAVEKPYEKVLGKRHTLLQQPYHELAQRLKELNITSAYEDIQKASYFLPRVEKDVEKEFLDDIKSKLSEVEKDQLDAVYNFRRRRGDRNTYVSFLKPLKPEVTEDPLPRIRPEYEMSDIKYPKYQDIGQYFILEAEMARKLYLNGFFGNFYNDNVALVQTYDVMMREETWRIINNARNTQKFNPQPAEEPLDLPPTLSEPLQQLGAAIFTHKQTYLSLHKSLSSLLLDILYSSTSSPIFRIMRNSPELFNSTIAILMQELSKSQLFSFFSKSIPFTSVPDYLNSVIKSPDLKSILTQILSNYSQTITRDEDINASVHFADYVRHISKEFKFTLNGEEFTVPLQQYSDHKARFRVPESLENEVDKTGSLGVGYLVSGQRGIGKSQILAGAAAWAFKEGNYVIVKVPRGSDFTKSASPYFWEPNGRYFHPEVGWDLLQEIMEINGDKLAEIPVDLSFYGKYSLSGMHPEYDKGLEPLINRHVFMREQLFWTDDWKKHYDEETLEETFKGNRVYEMLPRMTRFDYEVYRNSEKFVPQKFRDLMDDDNDDLVQEMELEDVLEVECPKRKPKKRMDPKTSAEDLMISTKKRTIHPQDLIKDKGLEGGFEELTRPLIELVPEPKNLKELVQFGLKNHVYSVNVLYELMEQLYRTDKCNVMVLVDQFDSFFKPSEYLSMKYMNFRQYRDSIPPTDISLSHLFMRFDGHMIRNGIKVVGTCEKDNNYQTQKWKGDVLSLGPDFCMEVEKMPLDDMRKLAKYLYFFQRTMFDIKETDIVTIHMMTQGNISLALDHFLYSLEETY